MEPNEPIPAVESHPEEQQIAMSISSSSDESIKSAHNPIEVTNPNERTMVEEDKVNGLENSNASKGQDSSSDDKQIIQVDSSTSALGDDEIAKENSNINQEVKPEASTSILGKRGRIEGSNDSSVLENVPIDILNSNNLNSLPYVNDEPPQKVPHIESSNSSEDTKEDDDNKDNSSYGDNLASTSRFTDTDSDNSLSTSNNGARSKPSNLSSDVNSREKSSNRYNFEMPECDEYFLSLINLDPVPESPPLPRLLPREVAQLELALQIGEKFKDHSDGDCTWREDWNGNLQLIRKDLIQNRGELVDNPTRKKITLTFLEWAAKCARHADDFTCVKLLFSYVYNMTDTPPMAKRILAHYINTPVTSILERLNIIEKATQRITYDPIVLKQDGWTTTKSDVPDGASGGAYMIGRKIMWQRYEAIVIAFMRDDDLGALWKCMWIEDLDTFDLEAGELQEGIKKWERKEARIKGTNKAAKLSKSSSSVRFEQNRNFTVKGVEDGIILATSYKTKISRPWPARIMHVTEVKAMGQLASRRSSSKNEIHVVFLAPYWNGQNQRSTNANSAYSSGPLFELETIDVSEDTIHEYPYDIESGTISIEKLRTAFGFLDLPKSAFSRYLNSHRLAMALKTYANKVNTQKSNQSTHFDALSSLTDTHPLTVRAFPFPDALVNLPFDYTLSKYPDPLKIETVEPSEFDEVDEITEPIMDLGNMLESICPPKCWNDDSKEDKNSEVNKVSYQNAPTPVKSPEKIMPKPGLRNEDYFTVEHFCSDYFVDYMDNNIVNIHVKAIKRFIEDLILSLNVCVSAVESLASRSLRQESLQAFLRDCLLTKVSEQYYPCVYR